MSVRKLNSQAFGAGDYAAFVIKENIIVARALHLAEFKHALFASHVVYIHKLRVHLIVSACDNVGKCVCRVKRGERCDAELVCAVEKLNVIGDALFIALAGVNNVIELAAFNQIHNRIIITQLVYRFNINAEA